MSSFYTFIFCCNALQVSRAVKRVVTRDSALPSKLGLSDIETICRSWRTQQRQGMVTRVNESAALPDKKTPPEDFNPRVFPSVSENRVDALNEEKFGGKRTRRDMKLPGQYLIQYEKQLGNDGDRSLRPQSWSEAHKPASQSNSGNCTSWDACNYKFWPIEHFTSVTNWRTSSRSDIRNCPNLVSHTSMTSLYSTLVTLRTDAILLFCVQGVTMKNVKISVSRGNRDP